MLDSKKMLCGCNIRHKDICTLQPPTLGTIFEEYELFVKSITWLTISKNQFVDMVKLNEIMDFKKQDDVSAFQLITLFPESREALRDALSFFIVEQITFDEQIMGFRVENHNGCIDNETFSNIVSDICRLCCITYTDRDTNSLKFKSKKAKEIYEKCMQGRQQAEEYSSKTRNDDDPSLEQMVSFLCVNSNSYNLTNVYNLTLYQFYNQFYQTCYNEKFKSSQHRWEVWGEKDFDFTLGYKGFDFSKL